MTEQSYKTSPKDIFLHLLSMVTLYASAVAFLTLLFQYINVLLPDPLELFHSRAGAFNAIRFSVATLIIVFPVFVWILRLLQNGYTKEPALREARIRKWLTYFTLFVAGVIVMGDLVTLVYSFLGGELTMRFVLKILAVFVVAASVFWYYFWDIKNIRPRGLQAFQYSIIGIVTISVIAAFFVVGSPQTERLRRFDSQRVSDVSQIQWQVLSYWQNKGALPEELSWVEDDISGFRVPTDPQTNEPYEYEVRGDLTFALCANFALSSANAGGPSMAIPRGNFDGSWEHGEGHTCFERTIDPDLYSLNEGAIKLIPAR